jgi:hypothetical protein
MTSSESPTSNRMTIAQRVVWIAAFAGALAAAGFIAGFIGPIVHHPASNQGPLLGIFITGPLGLVIGALLGIIVPLVTSKPQTLTKILVITTLLYAGGLWLALALTRDPGLPPDAMAMRLH